MKSQLDQDRELVDALESEAASVVGPGASEKEIRNQAMIIGHAAGLSYGKAKTRVEAAPGPIGRAFQAVAEPVGNVLGSATKFAGEALAERTPSLSDEDSSLPTFTVDFPRLGGVRDSMAEGMNTLSGALGMSRREPIPIDRPPPSMTFGPEFVADTVETLGPIASEVGLALRRSSPTTFVVGTVLANMSSEVGAEYLRALNREAAGLPNDVVNLRNPRDAARHFMKVAAGGAMLSTLDIAFNAGSLGTQRKVYGGLLGLGKEASEEAVARTLRLTGGKANLAEATTTGIKLVAHSLKVMPLTSKAALRRSRGLAARVEKVIRVKLSEVADNLASGIHFSAGVPSKAWQDSADAALQQSRKIATAAYDGAKKVAADAELRLGRDQVHVPHHEIREEMDDFILGRTADLPIVGDEANRRVAKSAIDTDPNFQLLNDVLDLDDTANIAEYMVLRNQLEAASEAAGGIHTQIGSVYGVAAMKMRHALGNMVAPENVKQGYAAATQTWGDMISFTQAPAWKHMRRADPKFGLPDKVPRKPTTTAEVTLQNAMADPDLSPEIVKHWWRAASEGGSQKQFFGAVEMHLRLGAEQATRVLDKGPLEGLPVMKYDLLETWLGLNQPSGNRWAAHKLMFQKAGVDPDEIVGLLRDAKRMFPEGIPMASTTAARRVGLAGIASAVRFSTGVGLVKGAGGDTLFGSIKGAAMTLITLMGAGQLFFNPAVLRRMRRVMHGGITEQGAWRTMFGVASSVGLSRAFQNSLQEQGIDPMFDASKAEQYLQAERLKEQRATDIFKTIKAKPGESGVFGVNPLTGKPRSAGNSTPVDQESGVSMRLQPGAVQ